MCKCSNLFKVSFQLGLTAVFCASELITGYAVNSNVLIADAFHMFSDVVSLSVSLAAIYKKDQNADSQRKTFGYRRAEPLGAMIHGALLVGLAFSVGTAAITDLIMPEKVEEPLYPLIVGSFGLVVDTCGLLLFFQEDLEGANMNVRSLFLEKIGDFVGTTVVITSCALAYAYQDDDWVQYVDPSGTLLMAVILLIAARTIFTMTVRILMCDAPSGFPLATLESEIAKTAHVKIVKNNIWQVDADELVVSMVVAPINGVPASTADVKILHDTVVSILARYGQDYETCNFTVQINLDHTAQQATGIYSNDGVEQISEKPRYRALSLVRSKSRSDTGIKNEAYA